MQTGTSQIVARPGSASTGGTFTVSAGAVLDLTGGAAQTHAITGTYTGSGAGKVIPGGGTLQPDRPSRRSISPPACFNGKVGRSTAER